MLLKSRTVFATFDGAAARAFFYDRANKRLSPLPGFPMEGDRKPEFDDKRPRSFQSAGTGRSAVEPQTDPEKLLERQFVSAVAARLEKLRASKSFDRLIVSAGPRALGYWRETAPKELAATVKTELAADHVRTGDTALVSVVEEAFFG